MWQYIIYSDDFNRVILKTIPEVDNSDYVNASYVDVSMIHCV